MALRTFRAGTGVLTLLSMAIASRGKVLKWVPPLQTAVARVIPLTVGLTVLRPISNIS